MMQASSCLAAEHAEAIETGVCGDAHNASPLMLTILSTLGAAALLQKCRRVLFEPCWYFFLRPATSFECFRGDWAIVTGASRGLGEAFSIALARRGLNIVLIARNKDLLDRVGQKCRECGAEVHVLALDLLEDPGGVSLKISQELSQLSGQVSVLVNNVGGKPPKHWPCSLMPCYCEELDGCSFESFYKANVAPAIMMTSLVLRGMIQRSKGYILNVSSMNGLQACPFLSPYSAAKAYLCSYSACLSNELRGRQSEVCVETVCPGPVATQGIGRAGLPSKGIPDPLEFAEQTLSLAKTPFVEMPWPRHWWNLQFNGPHSDFVSRQCAEARLYKAMDFSKMLGPPR